MLCWNLIANDVFSLPEHRFPEKDVIGYRRHTFATYRVLTCDSLRSISFR